MSSTLKVSLQTRDPKKALRASRAMIQLAEQLTHNGIACGMQYQELRALLTSHFGKILNQVKTQIDRDGRLQPDLLQAYRDGLAQAEAAIEIDAPYVPDATYQELLSGFISTYDIPLSKGDVKYTWLENDFGRAVRSFLREVVRYDTSHDDFDLGTPAVVEKTVDARPIDAVHQQQSPQTPHTITVSELYDRYLPERIEGKRWAASTILGNREYHRLLIELFGPDRTLDSFGPQEVLKVKDTLRALPPHRTKKPDTKGKTLAEVLTMEGLPKLSQKSINKYLQAYNDFFGYAAEHGFATRNPFANVSISQGRASREKQRSAFTPEQMQLLLGAVTENQMLYVRKSYQKWGTLIAAYTGARLNEIAQLDIADIQRQDGVWFFNFTDDGDEKQLKTLAAKRMVPLHRKLLELGLIEYVEELQKGGKTKLFPELPFSVEHGRGRNLGRYFNDQLLPRLNLKSKKLVFHSLRHTVVTQLMNRGVSLEVVRALVGHAQSGVTLSNYFGGFSLHMLNAGIQELDYSVRKAASDTVAD